MDTTTTVTPSEDQRLAAKRGAVLLDERMPGWAERIDPSTLVMSSSCHCVLGQLYRSEGAPFGYIVGADFLDLNDEGLAEHGFDSDDDGAWLDSNPDWNGLRAAWLEQIAERVSA